jgi:hypothetical protein
MNQQSVSIIENLPITKHSFSKSFINDVYTKWKHCENEWLDEKVVLDVSPIQFQDSLNNKQLEQVSTFDETVRNNLQNSSGFNQRFKITLSSNIYTIFMFYPTKNKRQQSSIVDFFSDCSMKIYIWLCYIQPFIRTNCSKTMDVHIWFSSEKKLLIHREKIMSSKHANSAFTTSCREDTSIYIYRKEEWLKVFIHETFHSLGLDFSHIANNRFEMMVSSLFPVKSTQGIRSYESYCEFWAEMYHIVFVSFFQTTSKSEFRNISNELLKNEIQFSAFQLIKILKHFDPSLRYNSFIQHKTSLITENTSVLSYYVMKFVLLFFCNDFEEWCKKYNGSLFLRFDDKNIPRFVEFIQSHYNSKSLLHYLDLVEESMMSLKLNNELQRTMRMTLNEL